MAHETLPLDPHGFLPGDQTRLVVAPAWTDPKTGAVYVHKDLVSQPPNWAIEEHVGPIKAAEPFGDVQSWTDYVKRFAGLGSSLLTWNSHGLLAMLDYHTREQEAGRCQWTASQPFTLSSEWRAWANFANGQPVTQRHAIEKLEDLGEDIVDPPQTTLTQMLRELRANATAQADTELRPDGTASISFRKDQSVSNKAGTMELPPVIRVAIPVLSGDTVRYELKVRMRVSVDDAAKLTFRFSIVNAERVLEVVYAEKVEIAKGLLGEDFALLRADG